MEKSRSRVYHRAKGQVRRDALLHSRSRRLYYRSWTKQAGRRLRLNGTTHESIRGDRVHSGDVKSRRIDPHRPPRSARAAKSWQHRTPTWLAQTKSGTSPAVAAKTRSEQCHRIAPLRARLTHEQRLKDDQPNVVRPSIGADPYRVRALAVRAINQEPANA